MSPLVMLVGLALVLGGCNDGVDPGDDSGSDLVVEGPVVYHDGVSGPLLAGQPVELSLDAHDDDGVLYVSAYVRTVGESAWETVPLELHGEVWRGQVPGSEVQPPALQYYFKATDDSQYRAVTYLPAEGLDGPFEVDVARVGAALPFFESFEGGGHLFSQGWFEYSGGFAGYTWTTNNSRAYSGTSSVVHRRGVQGVAAMDDWLVSPALDLRGADPSAPLAHVQATWQELGTQSHLATHSLWLSTGSRDPAHGDYELVEELRPATDDTWSRSRVVDLSAWAGEQAVHLAWRYEGSFADAWYIDDVLVRAMASDLHVTSVSWTPVEPGGATTVTVSLENRTAVDALGLTLTPTADVALGSFSGAIEAGDVPGNSGVSVDLSLTVDPSHPNNARLPFTLTGEAGGEAWTWDLGLVVGEASSAHVALTLDAESFVSARLGVGDPDAPDFTIPVTSGLLPSGRYAFDVDVTARWDALPPSPGPDRWWLSVESSKTGEVDAFEISFDGTTYVSDDLTGFNAGARALYYLPRPPEPAVSTSVTDPATLSPGADVAWAVKIRNDGASTVGRTTVTLSSSDPDVVISTSEPIRIATDGWPSGAVATLDLGFQLLASQDDSRPVAFTLSVADEVEAFPIRVELPVPWPVLQVTGVRVDDWSEGDDDGLLSSGETAHLELDLTNVGGLATFGPVNCALAQVGGEATAEVIVAQGNFATLSTNQTRSEDDFKVRVTGGAAGDALDFELTCSDSAQTYRTRFQIALGEVPFVFITPINDPPADAQNGYGFDFVNGMYRSDGDTLDIVLISSVPYNAGTLFIEAWARSTGSPYSYYQLVSQSGSLTLRGFQFGVFTRLTEPTITEIDEHSLMISIELAPLGLVLDTMDIGFAAGFCGGTTYYCDQFPDGWGNAYQTGLVTSRWVTLSW